MFEKYHELCRGQPECGEDLADVLYELGSGLCDRKLYDLAVRWLERAFDALDEHEIDRLSDDAGDLKLAILQKLSEYVERSQWARLMACSQGFAAAEDCRSHRESQNLDRHCGSELLGQAHRHPAKTRSIEHRGEAKCNRLL